MGDLTVSKFVDVVQRSQLVDRDQLAATLKSSRGNAEPQTAEAIAGLLHQRGLITSWQQKNLLAGKSRGFFLGNYRLLDHLGTGGMSSVFLAAHRRIDRKVAIKVLPTSRKLPSSFLDRFEREARSLSLLSHLNIVRVFDMDEQNGTHFMVMEYVDGRDLKAVVNASGPLALDRAAHYIAQAAAGLQHAHERGLVHRDVKPANLIVDGADVVKILDLGLARAGDEDELASLTTVHAENTMGTADYLAPEQARDPHSVDHRADIYSLGCTFYFLLTGHAPFAEGPVAQRILMHQTAKPVDVRASREDCPHAIADAVMTMLAKEPHARFDSADVVAARLRDWLSSHGAAEFAAPTAAAPSVQIPLALPEEPSQDGQRNVQQEPRIRKAARRPPLGFWVFLAVLVLICIVLFVVLLLRE